MYRYILYLLTLFPFVVRAQDTCARLNITTIPTIYDSMIACWKADGINENFATYREDYITLDTSRYLSAVSTVSDIACKARLKGIVSPIHLPYNEIVRKHIVAYTTTHKSITRRMLGSAKCYFPMIEQELAKAGLPLELKFIAVVESALNPMASSPGGAAGLWQFMLPTGRHYGLEISSMVDMRHDPVESTRAACRYLQDLYKIYNDWTLVLASYNYGPGNVNKALQRAGGHATTYWDIYPYMPQTTRDYIPAFVALTYLYYYHSDYGIVPFSAPLPLATDTVMVNRRTDLNRVCETLNLPSELLRHLNPQYKSTTIPATIKSYPLVLPQKEISRFLSADSLIYKQADADIDERLHISNKSEHTTTPQNGDDYSGPEPKTYRVKSGDTLGFIAKKHGVTVNQLMQWNKLPNSRLRIGQTLKIIR